MLLRLRFVLYAVVLALGAAHLVQRGDDGEARSAVLAPDFASEPWRTLHGSTSQGLRVRVLVQPGRVGRVHFEWRGTCSDGRTRTFPNGDAWGFEAGPTFSTATWSYRTRYGRDGGRVWGQLSADEASTKGGFRIVSGPCRSGNVRWWAKR